MGKKAFRLLTILVGLAGVIWVLPGGGAQAGQTISRPQPQRVIKPSVAQVATAEREITPPASVAAFAKPDSVTLKAGSTSTVMQSLRVKRAIPVSALRANPVIMLGKFRTDLTPVLNNPASLMNIASRLHSLPGLVEVVSEDTEVLEVEQGLVIRQFLAYRLKTGVCANPGRRAQLAPSGVGCFTRMTDDARAASFSDPGDPHYIADPAKRAQAVASAAKEVAAEKADFASGISEFRVMMNDPARRAQVEAEIGASEAARLQALGDEQLAGEIVNSAETRIEEVMFMPAGDRLDKMTKPGIGRINVPKMQLPEKVDIEHSLQQHVFLTGFTLGRENEWRKRVSVTIKTCLVSCKKTYYAEVSAGFGYGFGLRFPVRVGGLYAYHRVGDQESASIAPVFEPIDGNAGDYSETGLPGDRVFQGRELVAELVAYAGLNFKVPFYSDGVLSAKVGEDLTEGLPAPFTRGQFRPPAPGDGNSLDKEIIFDDDDLLAGLVNFGVVGAQVLPALKVGLTSDHLQLKLKDNLSGAEVVMFNSGQVYPLNVDPQDHSSSFTIGYPEYSLAFHATPGLAARLFIDVSVWSHNWDWPVWFPQVAVTLPPEGMAFTCHELTICSRNYRFSATLTKDEAGPLQKPDDALAAEVYDWRNAFQEKWLGQCPYLPVRFCEAAIRAVTQTTGNQMLNEMRAQPAYPSLETATIMIRKAVEADNKAKDIILETRIASVDNYGRGLFAAYESIWSLDCADQLCHEKIHALGEPYVQALMARQKAAPSLERNEVVFLENTQGNWAGKASQEIEASRARSGSRVAPIEQKRIKLKKKP